MKRFIYLFAGLMFLTIVTQAQTYQAIASKSNIKWTGKKVTGEHFGNIKLKEGTFTLKDNKVTEGIFVVDMSSITNEDLQGEWSTKLVDHLKSADFFGVEDHPAATLKITGSSELVNNKTNIKGMLTIKGITHPIEFEGTQANNTFTAKIVVDRTKYDVRYGSGKFFDNLGDKAIDDNFTLEVEINASSELTSK